MEKTALILHPTREEKRTFVGDDLVEKLGVLKDQGYRILAVTQNGYDDDLVGEKHYDRSFPDRHGQGNLTSDLTEEMMEIDRLLLGGGEGGDCVAQAAYSVAVKGYENIVAGKEVTYVNTEEGVMSLDEMPDERILNEAGSLPTYARIESIFD